MMSKLYSNLKTSPEEVMPYLEYLFTDKIQRWKPIAMYLVGSRGRTPVSEWDKLKGRDWDILLELPYVVKDTHLWLEDGKEFYIDLICDTPFRIHQRRQAHAYGYAGGIQLFPNTHKDLIQYLV